LRVWIATILGGAEYGSARNMRSINPEPAVRAVVPVKNGVRNLP
jgi:hypothetical protein